jgi:hypothetical protein
VPEALAPFQILFVQLKTWRKAPIFFLSVYLGDTIRSHFHYDLRLDQHEVVEPQMAHVDLEKSSFEGMGVISLNSLWSFYGR